MNTLYKFLAAITPIVISVKYYKQNLRMQHLPSFPHLNAILPSLQAVRK